MGFKEGVSLSRDDQDALKIVGDVSKNISFIHLCVSTDHIFH